MTITEERRRSSQKTRRNWTASKRSSGFGQRKQQPTGIERILVGGGEDPPFGRPRKLPLTKRARDRTAAAVGAARKAVRSPADNMPPEERADRTLQSAALALTMAGLCVVLFLVYAFVFTGLQEARSQRALLNAYQQPNRFTLLSGKPVAEGSPVAVLEIPALGLKQVVVQGTSATDLLKGPGLMPDTAQPGTQGNSVIAGRRDTAGAPFSSIGSLHRGDPITVVTALGKFRYKVEGGGLVHIGADDPISPTDSARLTLVTSDPPLIPSGREYVTARLVTQAAKAPLPTHAPSPGERGLSGDASAFWPAVLWGLILAGAFALTIAAYRRAPRQRWTVYLLSTPIVAACALVWFENLIRLLPATL